MRVFYPVFQVTELAAGYRYTTLHKCCRCTPEFASATNYPVEQSILILALFCLDDGVRFTDHGVEDQTGILSSRKWLIG